MVRDALAESLRDALAALGVSPVPAQVHLERPARREHGDWSTQRGPGRRPRPPVASPASWRRSSPTASTAAPPPHVESVEVAGPGFVNFRLRPTWLHDVLRDVVEQGTDTFARPDLGHGRKVNVEFVVGQPHRVPCTPVTPAAPPTATRWPGCSSAAATTCTASSTSTTAACRWTPSPQSLAARKAGGEPPEDGYHGQYIIDWAAEMPDGADPLEWGYAAGPRRPARGARHGSASSSTPGSASGRSSSPAPSRQTLADLRAHGVVYDADGAMWLRTHRLRRRQGPRAGQVRRRVHLPAARHRLPPRQVRPRLRPAHRRVGRRPPRLRRAHEGRARRRSATTPTTSRWRSPRLVRLERDGDEVKISKRTGDLIELRDLLDEVGPDAVRLTYLLQSHRHAARPSTSTWSRPSRWTTRSSTCRWRTPGSHSHRAGGRRARASRACPLADVDLGAAGPRARARRAAQPVSELPDVVELAAPSGRRTRSPTWVRELAGARSTASTTTARPGRRRRRPSSRRPACGWSRRRGSASPSASTCSASRRPSRCRSVP